MLVKKVGQIWFTGTDGVEYPYNNKFYSKIGVAENLAKKYSASTTPYKFFVKVYHLEFIGDIR